MCSGYLQGYKHIQFIPLFRASCGPCGLHKAGHLMCPTEVLGRGSSRTSLPTVPRPGGAAPESLPAVVLGRGSSLPRSKSLILVGLASSCIPGRLPNLLTATVKIAHFLTGLASSYFPGRLQNLLTATLKIANFQLAQLQRI